MEEGSFFPGVNVTRGSFPGKGNLFKCKIQGANSLGSTFQGVIIMEGTSPRYNVPFR